MSPPRLSQSVLALAVVGMAAVSMFVAASALPSRGSAAQQWSPAQFQGSWYLHKFAVTIDAAGYGRVSSTLGFDQDFWWEVEFQLFTGVRDSAYGYVTAANLGSKVVPYEVGVSAGGTSTPVMVTLVPYGGLILSMGWQHLTFVCRSVDGGGDGPLPGWYERDFCPLPA
ncbi:MAG: hypothetical protein ACRDJE_00890 [Dehalococcoidia bacterium]